MKEQILRIIAEKPMCFSPIIKKQHQLWQWVVDNSLVKSDNLSEMIYSAVNHQSNICKNGKQMQFTSFKAGYRGCGATGKCACANEKVSSATSATKKKVASDLTGKLKNGNPVVTSITDLKSRLTDFLKDIDPKHYSMYIRKNVSLFKEVLDATDKFSPESDSERCYIILNGPPPMCKYGNKRKLNSFVKGYWAGCVNPNCSCSKESQREKMSQWHQNQSS